MTHRQIAFTLTLFYWVAAVLMATLAPSSGWLDLRWPIAIYFFAIPTSILLWVIVICAYFLRPAWSRSRLTLIGIALPAVYLMLAVGGGHWWQEKRMHSLEEQMRVATLVKLEDEPLIVTKGPIGVTLRYRVVYPLGLDLDEGHGASAQLTSMPSRGEFVKLRRVVMPPVSSHYAAGAYDFTEEFVPAFLPPSLLYASSEPAAADRCFRWSHNLSRQQVLAGNAETQAVAIVLWHNPIQRFTTRTYQLAEFYATAARAGATDCVD